MSDRPAWSKESGLDRAGGDWKPLLPRPSATLILLRDGPGGFEVLLLRRTAKAAFAAGNYVFPGGALDPGDGDPRLTAHCPIDDGEASRRLGVDAGGLALLACGLRECFEEAGILLARHADGRPVDPAAPALAADRRALIANALRLPEFCARHDLVLAIDAVGYLSHWITPPSAPRRFDTRFLVALAPDGQTAAHDGTETVDHLWIAPAEALARHARDALPIVHVTSKMLEALACFDSAQEALDHALEVREIPTVSPHIGTGRAGRRIIGPDDYAFAEIGRLDPQGRVSASYEILAGVPVTLGDGLRRITAPNPGFMTGPGTNSYLLGDAHSGIAVLDPGPADAGHVRVLLEEAGGPIRWILATHTHPDHSPAAALLKAATGAEVLGMPPPAGALQDATFAPDRVLADGMRIEVGGRMLRAIHTPGHASNHLCYLLEDERLLFTGDQVMQGSTVVIGPPDGDMAAYLASLRRLLGEDLAWLAPGHGFLMDNPHHALERIVLHRLERENKVWNALNTLGMTHLDALLPVVYDDVPARVHPVARRSLLAHLEKLEAEARVARDGERWQAA
jgi:glyoxylase-like metal-dependent hydrolase (beta-lactamase superfamily II)/8-oxo-dGTP pyrophosphatase MutT (NUDIX family)